MQIKSTRRPEFRQFALGQQPTPTAHAESSAPPTVGLAGAMFCVTDPPPWLASRAQQALGLRQLPRDLLLGVPAAAAFGHLERPPSGFADKELELIGETCDRAVRLVSKLIADQPRMPGWVGTAVRAGWLLYGAARLMDKWRGGADVPTLSFGVAKLALEGAEVGQKVGVLPDTGFFDPSVLGDVGVAVVAAEAVLGSDDVAIALLDKQFAGSHDLYKAAKVFEPIVGACLSSDPAFAGFQLYPFPHGRGSRLGELSSGPLATARSIDEDPQRGVRSTSGR